MATEHRDEAAAEQALEALQAFTWETARQHRALAPEPRSEVPDMGRGELTPDEAADAAVVVERLGAAWERRDLEERVRALEGQSRT